MLVRSLWFVTGCACVGIGAVGVVVPGLPTTFPMILALACFARSSHRLHRWLFHHRLFGPPLQRWVAHRVVPRRAKVFALGGMSTSLLVMVFLTPAPLVAVLVTVAVMIAGAAYILRCPSDVPAGDDEPAG